MIEFGASWLDLVKMEKCYKSECLFCWKVPLNFPHSIDFLQLEQKMYIGKRVLVFSFHHTKYCIIGGGTGGLNTASHLLRSNVRPTDIRIFEPAEYHYYQPGWTMIGFNMVEPRISQKKMEDVIPEQSHWTKERVVKIDPTKNILMTDKGHEFHYDQLIVSAGYKNDWHKIKGAKELLDDPQANVVSIYDHDYSLKTGKLGERFKKGKAIFTEPMMPIKCAGAPQKILYLWSNEWRDREYPIDIEYIKTGAVMFGVPKYSETLKGVAKKYNVGVTFKHNLVQVTKDKAIFENLDTKEKIEKPYDFLHIVPPMSPPEFLQESGISNEAGFVDVDKYTCRHNKYPNIWALGDCSSLPCSKTAAAIFSQTIVLTNNILAAQKNPNLKELPEKYDGYASCPLFTGDKQLMLAEFKYDGEISETFIIDQSKPRRLFYYLKKYFFPMAYWQLVPKGLWNGRKGIRWI